MKTKHLLLLQFVTVFLMRIPSTTSKAVPKFGDTFFTNFFGTPRLTIGGTTFPRFDRGFGTGLDSAGQARQGLRNLLPPASSPSSSPPHPPHPPPPPPSPPHPSPPPSSASTSRSSATSTSSPSTSSPSTSAPTPSKCGDACRSIDNCATCKPSGESGNKMECTSCCPGFALCPGGTECRACNKVEGCTKCVCPKSGGTLVTCTGCSSNRALNDGMNICPHCENIPGCLSCTFPGSGTMTCATCKTGSSPNKRGTECAP